MAKTDYKHHQREFSKLLAQNPKLTLQEYCASVGLTYSTARRHLSKKDAKASVTTKITSAQNKASQGRAKTDWHGLLKLYLSQAAANPTYTIKEFAEQNDLNPATTRKQFNRMRDLSEFASLWDLYDEKKAQFQVANNKRRSAKSGRTVDSWQGRETHAQARLDKIQSKKDHNAAEKPTQTDTNHALMHMAVPQVAAIGDVCTSRSVSRPTKHGGYLKLASISLDILNAVTEIDPLSANHELILARANYLTMQQDINNRLVKLLEMKANGEPLFVGSGDDAEEVDIDREIDKIRYGYSPRLRELEASINQFLKSESKRYIDIRKQELAELMMPSVLPAQQQRIVMELLEQRKKKNWTATETCQHIEAQGAEPPALLLHEAKLELANVEVEIDDDGVDEEVLDAEFGQYTEEHNEQVNEWVDERREEVAREIQLAEDREAGHEPEISPSQITESAETQEAYDELDEATSELFDLADFEVLGGEEDQERT
ncbi:hypothetical protein P3551_23030 [Vibrio parahaemolyticus]|uniref:hypothetical protein n=1 Tax=Vibrio parahaemolyticus TaxID=670 RepID=UPI001121FD71|nr:hypothetical protein [Vibrio parahaemolyticus]MBE4286378.1 hypothetical protein [Vibrio parahaemolyticus]MDF4902160.1 hypothetical protein [Vibrio parahaemolyticus]TOH19135.1 hypothetical protein CGI90_03920 [Vibrio parahaemolyticus]HCM0701205.1 hypothetical protein [Vibrio parahaemolyticus]HCM0798071.1 hypothetical protein [Vibrio parahaemolyticus]